MKKYIYIALCLFIASSVNAARHKQFNRAPGSLTHTVPVTIYAVDVTAAFSEVQDLNLATLGLTGHLIDPLLDLPDLIMRLPSSGVTIPMADFPVRIDISPPAAVFPLTTELQFEGVAMITLDTINLIYTPATRLRLFSAHDGGPFVDITEEVSEGSYRVRGSRGEFSEFMIVLDERDPAAIVSTKFSRLSALLATHASAIDNAIHTILTGLVSSAQSHYTSSDIDSAKLDIGTFISTVSAATPAQIPNVWRAAEDVTNVAGILNAAAGTLRFSLEDARDTDLDGVYDFEDNCLAINNPSQCNTDSDAFGNHCDADLNGDNIVNSFDLSALRKAFGQSGELDADLNCDGIVNSFDLSIMRSGFGLPPGP
ncbi:MAG: hypothetical protein HKN85_01015 [Gammaproteobacteria bacterium]|nr:hypothetical protein [Gammaproteobacteria bacterium]